MPRALRLPPDAALKTAGHRLRMVAALPRLAVRNDPASRAIARALSTTAAGRIPVEERGWAARIEARRREVAELGATREPHELGVWDQRRAVQWMSTPPVLGRLLMRLVRELRPESCLELGTGFGISGAYLAAALELEGSGRLITIDADARPAAVATEGFAALGLMRAEVRAGEPGATLAQALDDAAPVQFGFIDADHRESATLATLDAVLPALAPGAVIVFDDVSRSWQGMGRAWAAIAAHERVSGAHHLGRIGIVAIA